MMRVPTKSFVALILAGVGLSGAAAAQTPPLSLEAQLRTDYVLVKTGNDAYGLAIVEPGTVLVLQKSILGVPSNNAVTCSSQYQDSNLKGPGGFCQLMVKNVSRFLQPGERVYPWKLEINLAKDKITMGIVECDACNGVQQQPLPYKGEVNFQFPKGYLATADPAKVEEVINEVLAFEPPPQAAPEVQAAPAPPPPQADPPPQQPAPPPPEPQTIEVGQTPEQVEAALGKPEKIVKLTSKQIWVYKDLKVTFVKGKVSDVQ